MKAMFEVNPEVNGTGIVKFAWQKSGGNYLAVTGSNKVVNIYDRHGEHKRDVIIILPGYCTSLDWDKDGDILTVAHDKNGILHLWNSHNFEVSKFDTGMKKIPILGKHTRKVTCGCWSSQNLLALGADDRTVTISNAEGDTLRQVSIVVGHKTLFLYDMDNAENPIELAFQQRYGDIITYKWYGDGYIMIGFSNGFFVVISTHRDEIGQEMFQSRNHKNFLSDVAISSSLNQAASCGDNSIKIHDLNELKEVYTIVNVEEEKGTLHNLGWTNDGQLLTVSTLSGGILTFLAKLPMLGDAHGLRLAYLTSLLEVTIVNNVDDEPPLKLDVTVEPNFISLGPFHIAIGMNDRVWIHEIGEQGAVFEKSYLGSVSALKLNNLYAAVLFEGKVQLHAIDPNGDAFREISNNGIGQTDIDREIRIFPDEGSEDVISCLCLTPEFLIYGTDSGKIVIFFIEDWQFINEYRHVLGITKINPDIGGLKLIVMDEKSDAFIYNPITNSLLEVPEFPPTIKTILWENASVDKHIFIASDTEFVYTYAYFGDTINGPVCNMVGSTKLPFGHLPLMLCNGEVSCQTLTGKISIMKLNTHIFTDDQGMTEDELKASMRRCISLKKFKDAWSFATALDTQDTWNELAEATLQHVEVSIAIRAYQQVKNVAMIYALQEIKNIEDHHLLLGHLCLLMGMYDQAQEHFLSSSNPVMALEMRRDLLNWDQALNLAKSLSPEQVPYISKEYAQQLEFTGDYANALLYYENGNTDKDPEHDEACKGGVARMAIRTGDVRRGVGIVQSLNNKFLLIECGDILESMKLYSEAGAIYEKSQCWDKAATVYTKIKNWNNVGKLLHCIASTKIHGQYAKAREADKQYMEAARAYEAAREYENAIRIYLDNLQLPDDAVRLVKEYNSIEGAKMVARFFIKLGDTASALNFLVLSHCQDEAFTLAQSQNCLEQYAEIIGDNAKIEDYYKIATHFESTGDHFKSGNFFFAAKEYEKALQHFLQCPISLDGENIDMAIKVAGQAKQDSLTQRLMDYLMGDIDATPKDAKFLFKLYLALGQYREAARTAVLIAKEDQTAGNYRNAHDTLFCMHSELNTHDIKIPSEMSQNLMILHSYILVKTHVKLGQHMKGARMLIRVANNISKFPSHIVPILTSTVIECHRSGLRNSAFSYATMLMRPEYRQNIDPKWKKKIEQIVRKPDKSELEEELAPCPNCSYLLPQTKLDCPQCKSTLPYCIVTGRHMIEDDWTECPVCKFPAIYTEFISFLKASSDNRCPMCSNSVEIAEVVRRC